MQSPSRILRLTDIFTKQSHISRITINICMTNRPILPSELDNVRSAYRRDTVKQRQHELQSNAEDVKTSLKHINCNQLSDWDLETLRMVDEILMDEKVLKLRREIKSLMKSAGKDYEIEKELWQRRKKRK